MISPSQHYQRPPDYDDYGFGQSMNLTSPPDNSSMASKTLVIAGILIVAILAIVGFFAVLRGDGPNNIDTLLIHQQNLLAIAEAAEVKNEDFDTEQIIVNSIILVKSDLAELQKYRDSEFEGPIDKELKALVKSSEDLESKFSEAKQVDQVPATFYELFGKQLDASIELLETFEAESRELESIIKQSLNNQIALKRAIESAQATP